MLQRNRGRFEEPPLKIEHRREGAKGKNVVGRRRAFSLGTRCPARAIINNASSSRMSYDRGPIMANPLSTSGFIVLRASLGLVLLVLLGTVAFTGDSPAQGSDPKATQTGQQ